MFYVYILKSHKDEGFYIGSTKDIEKRFYRHNRGLEASTRRRAPLTLEYHEQYQTLSEARKREAQIKKYKGGNAFKKLINTRR